MDVAEVYELSHDLPDVAWAAELLRLGELAEVCAGDSDEPPEVVAAPVCGSLGAGSGI